ncbi:PAS domain S-box protein [Flavivirga rizhaonensis]|uniref:PAS domain S-box protein n=1 Tax=Flavivirga rizhaonensis TaxID=2559571 RepID=A0A4S1DT52_9FLAO|nr:PAS domain S-box protein [Flavivirga rizhaonensis]TGV01181.1 PAS domain S-box protein [Flavivirga rizhaonensis]
MIPGADDLNLYVDDFFKTIFNTATESWILTDKFGVVRMINPTTTEMFGYEQSELIGQKIELLMPAKERKEHVDLRNNYIKHPRKRPHGIGVEVFALHKNKTEFPVEISLNHHKFNNETYALAVVIDITKRKEKEQKLQEAILEKEQFKQDKIKSELEVLKNQVNPHYFFNSLSVLAPLINIDQKKSQKFTEKLASTYRYILEIRDKLTVTVKEELRFIKDYEFLQAVRFNNKFIISYDVIKDDLKKDIVPFALQILIENVFKHNALYLNKKLNISIESKDGGIMVSNNINKKIDSKYKSFGIGLKNINEQYDRLSDQKPFFDEKKGFYEAWVPFIDSKVTK